MENNTNIDPKDKIVALMMVALIQKAIADELWASPTAQNAYDSFLSTIDFSKKVIKEEMPEMWVRYREELKIAVESLQIKDKELKDNWLERISKIELEDK